MNDFLLSDENLDFFGEVFLALQIRKLFRVTFEQFLVTPVEYVERAMVLIDGNGLCTYYNPPRPVVLH